MFLGTIFIDLANITEIQDIPRFAQHQFGEPSPKLFVKNLIKGVKLEELHYVFGRYFESDEQMSRCVRYTKNHLRAAFYFIFAD
jgi:hypothetical protein